MAELIIKGRARQLAKIARQIRLRASKYGLIVKKKGFEKKLTPKPKPPTRRIVKNSSTIAIKKEG